MIEERKWLVKCKWWKSASFFELQNCIKISKKEKMGEKLVQSFYGEKTVNLEVIATESPIAPNDSLSALNQCT